MQFYVRFPPKDEVITQLYHQLCFFPVGGFSSVNFLAQLQITWKLVLLLLCSERFMFMERTRTKATANTQTVKCHFGGLFIQRHLAEVSVQQQAPWFSDVGET